MGIDLAALATDEDLAPVWREVHARLCAGTTAERLVTCKVAGLTPAGIAALRAWVDTTSRRRGRASAVKVLDDGVRVPVAALREVLGLSTENLVRLVEDCVGAPVVDRSSVARELRAAKEQMWTQAEALLARTPQLLSRLREAGTSDPEQTAQLVRAVGGALARLPAQPAVTLPKLAHDVSGDPHFFDLDTRAGKLLVWGVGELLGQEISARPDAVRALLLRAGVIADRLSSVVLVVGVKVCGDGVIDRRLAESEAPVALTLYDLTVTPPRLTAGQVLTVVENPSVLEVAMQRGATSVACTFGQLRGVDHELLSLAASCGVRLRYAGDLDPSGEQIANTIARDYGAEIVQLPRSGPVYQESDEHLAALLGPDTGLPDA